MSFNINLERIKLDEFRLILMKSDLVPSRAFLKEQAEPYFTQLANYGIQSVGELFKALKPKGGVEAMSEQTSIPTKYLSVLMREIKGYIRSPIKLEKFPGLAADTVPKLTAQGLQNTVHVFNKVLTRQRRAELAAQAQINEQEILKVTKLVDLTRIRWVNETFAYAMHEAGLDTAEKVANADPEEMYMRIKEVNEERKFFPAHLGMADIKRCIDFAQLVSFDIEY